MKCESRSRTTLNAKIPQGANGKSMDKNREAPPINQLTVNKSNAQQKLNALISRKQDEGPENQFLQTPRGSSMLRPPTPIRKSEALEATLKKLELGNESSLSMT